jgi:hypothetical protein
MCLDNLLRDSFILLDFREIMKSSEHCEVCMFSVNNVVLFAAMTTLLYLSMRLKWNRVHYYWAIYWPIVPTLDDRW